MQPKNQLPAPIDIPPMNNTLVEVLQDQLRQAREREMRLLAMLENEQQARRDLEYKAQLPPQLKPPLPLKQEPSRYRVLWIVLPLILAAAASATLLWNKFGATWLTGNP
ncbi:MAG: hypothetical protein QG599_3150 [Pseudomonadota bacterium]|nr:hypothetical protein [Pseudomonadota bacterium]